jgi:hypothetical protein
MHVFNGICKILKSHLCCYLMVCHMRGGFVLCLSHDSIFGFFLDK